MAENGRAGSLTPLTAAMKAACASRRAVAKEDFATASEIIPK
jgi:hypothetical protein